MPVSRPWPALPKKVTATLMAVTLSLTIAVTIAAVSPSAQPPDNSSPYLSILTRYREGTDDESDSAVEALAALPESHSQARVLKELDRIAHRIGVFDIELATVPQRMSLAGRWAGALPAAAAMHLEAEFKLRYRAYDGRSVAHAMTARAIVDSPAWAFTARARPEQTERQEAFRRDVYLAVTWILQTYRMFDMLAPHLERTRDRFPDDPMVKLASGSLEEVKATVVETSRLSPPTSHAMPPIDAWRRQSQQARLDKAIDHYRGALNRDPSLTEARLRLGRVLRLRGKMKDARRELEMVVASTLSSASSGAAPALPAFGPRMVVPYLGAMFLAETIELEGDAGGALKLYQEVARRWPECQSGLLALGRAYEARGDREAALRTLGMLHREQAQRECVDPWWTYHLGQGWRFGPLITDLRTRVKGRS